MIRLTALILALLIPFSGIHAASAAPVSEAERVDIDIRRTTLVVQDIDASLALYRDVLGLKVIYDNQILRPNEATEVDNADRAMRLVFLRANDTFIGVLGLLQYIKPLKEPLAAPKPFTPGTPVLLFNTERLNEKVTAASALPGVTVVSEPSEVVYPSYDGAGEIRVMVSVVTDPDGFVLEVNQVLDGM